MTAEAQYGTVVAYARALRSLPRETIIQHDTGHVRSWFVKINDHDEWHPCDREGNIPHGADKFASDSVFLPVLVVKSPRPDRAPAIAESLLAVTLNRHAAIATKYLGGILVEVTCNCGVLCHDHPAHQTEAVIAAAIEGAHRGG